MEIKYFASLCGLNQIGEFKVIRNKEKKNMILSPVIVYDSYADLQKNNEKVSLLIGYIDIDTNFKEFPIEVNYIQLEKINRFIDSSCFRVNLEVYFRIYNKEKSKYRNIVFCYDENYMSFDLLELVVNILNYYIDKNNNIDDLDINKLNSNYIRNYDNDIIFRCINELKLDSYDNSLSRVGRDNYFWEETEIRNLPESNYLRKLIITSLKKQCKRIESTKYGLIITFETESNWSPSQPRKKSENQLKKETEIKGYLMIDVAISYFHNDYLVDLILKSE